MATGSPTSPPPRGSQTSRQEMGAVGEIVNDAPRIQKVLTHPVEGGVHAGLQARAGRRAHGAHRVGVIEDAGFLGQGIERRRSAGRFIVSRKGRSHLLIGLDQQHIHNVINPLHKYI